MIIEINRRNNEGKNINNLLEQIVIQHYSNFHNTMAFF